MSEKQSTAETKATNQNYLQHQGQSNSSGQQQFEHKKQKTPAMAGMPAIM
jgi:hypothetical protein